MAFYIKNDERKEKEQIKEKRKGIEKEKEEKSKGKAMEKEKGRSDSDVLCLPVARSAKFFACCTNSNVRCLPHSQRNSLPVAKSAKFISYYSFLF